MLPPSQKCRFPVLAHKAPPFGGAGIASAMTERVFLLKTKIGTCRRSSCRSRFCFLLHRMRYQTHPAPRFWMQSKPCCIRRQKEKGMEEWSFAPYARSLRAETLQTPLPFSGATRLGSPNPVARTEYHRRLVLSTPFFRFLPEFFCLRQFLPLFFAFCPKKGCKAPVKSTCYHLHSAAVLAIIITQHFVGRAFKPSTICSCRLSKQAVADPAPGSHHRSAPRKPLLKAVFQWSDS